MIGKSNKIEKNNKNKNTINVINNTKKINK